MVRKGTHRAIKYKVTQALKGRAGAGTLVPRTPNKSCFSAVSS